MCRCSLRLALPLCALIFAACTPLPAPAPANPAALQPAATTVLSGTVLAPVGVIAAGGGNAIAAGGGNVIGNATANFAVLAVAVAPLPNAEVFVADATGVPLPGTVVATTDAQGRYTLTGVPRGTTVVVTSRVKTATGKPALLQTIARIEANETRADLGLATTMVTARLLAGKDSLGDFDTVMYQRAVDSTAAHQQASDPEPDLADRPGLLQRVNTLAAQSTDLKAAVETLERTLVDLAGTVADSSPLPLSPVPSPSPTAAPASSGSGSSSGSSSSTSGAVGAAVGAVLPVSLPVVTLSMGSQAAPTAAPTPTPTPLLKQIVGGLL